MNYNEMSAAQCADWLAGNDGWLFNRIVRHWENSTTGQAMRTHPFPLTLDFAAGALREPWKWDAVAWWNEMVRVSACKITTWEKLYVDGPDELTARYRAAVAARMEEET